MMNVPMFKNLFFIVGTVVILLLAFLFFPIDRINWGRFSILPAATITVTGTATGNVANQKASFSATVSGTNSDKQTAINTVNNGMASLIKALKDFGLAESDITTAQITVYQQSTPVPVPMMGQTQTTIYPMPPIRTGGNGDWFASNMISVTLGDVSKASSVADILNKYATNVYGPNLSVGDSPQADNDLLMQAVNDAKAKAQTIAKSGGQTLGKMINVQESGSNYPMPLYATKDVGLGAGTATPVQPGSSSLTKSVTVVFELK